MRLLTIKQLSGVKEAAGRVKNFQKGLEAAQRGDFAAALFSRK